jgi:hypothetical protein
LAASVRIPISKYPLLLLSPKRFNVPSCIGDAPSLSLSAHILESVRNIYSGYDENCRRPKMFLDVLFPRRQESIWN